MRVRCAYFRVNGEPYGVNRVFTGKPVVSGSHGNAVEEGLDGLPGKECSGTTISALHRKGFPCFISLGQEENIAITSYTSSALNYRSSINASLRRNPLDRKPLRVSLNFDVVWKTEIIAVRGSCST